MFEDCYNMINDNVSDSNSCGIRDADRSPVVLCLDSQIQCLPFESLDVLRSQPACRLSCIEFAVQLIRNRSVSNNELDISNTFYVLNPNGDLKKTQDNFEKAFKKNKGWSGIVGRKPTSDEYLNALVSSDFFMYFLIYSI